MKAILISIRPQWVAKILNGEKTIEVRKGTALYNVINRLIKEQGKAPCLIYCTKQKILGNLIKVGSEENSKLFGKNAIVGINKGFMQVGDIDLQGKVIAEFEASAETILNHGSIDETDTMYTKYYGGHFENYIPKETISEEQLLTRSCLIYRELDTYLRGKNGTAIHVHNLKIFDKPKELEEFEYPNPSGVRYIGQRAIKGLPSKKRPPQSWCYCEVEE